MIKLKLTGLHADYALTLYGEQQAGPYHLKARRPTSKPDADRENDEDDY